MEISSFAKDELLLRNRLFMVGDFDMPFVYSQDVNVKDIALLGFNNTRAAEDSQKRKAMTVHFFLEDSQFDEVWNDPPRQLRKLSQYAQLLSPDFSVFTDMPEPLQIYNTFRNRWCAAYWQYHCQVVIPTVTWGLENTFDFCFDGIEEGCIVAVSTVGALDNQNTFMAGYREMCVRIKPEAVINFGKRLEGIEDMAEVIEIPYTHGSHFGNAE